MQDQRAAQLEVRNFLFSMFSGICTGGPYGARQRELEQKRAAEPCDDPTSEPCDDSDDGFNKTSSERACPTTLSDGNFYFSYDNEDLDDCLLEDVESVEAADSYPGYVGITYHIGDTTTFSPGPYDESLGVPVAVHFKG